MKQNAEHTHVSSLQVYTSHIHQFDGGSWKYTSLGKWLISGLNIIWPSQIRKHHLSLKEFWLQNYATAEYSSESLVPAIYVYWRYVTFLSPFSMLIILSVISSTYSFNHGYMVYVAHIIMTYIWHKNGGQKKFTMYMTESNILHMYYTYTWWGYITNTSPESVVYSIYTNSTMESINE